MKAEVNFARTYFLSHGGDGRAGLAAKKVRLKLANYGERASDPRDPETLRPGDLEQGKRDLLDESTDFVAFLDEEYVHAQQASRIEPGETPASTQEFAYILHRREQSARAGYDEPTVWIATVEPMEPDRLRVHRWRLGDSPANTWLHRFGRHPLINNNLEKLGGIEQFHQSDLEAIHDAVESLLGHQTSGCDTCRARTPDARPRAESPWSGLASRLLAWVGGRHSPPREVGT